MLRDITIGQYYQAESPIHRLDPRVKLISTVFFMISLFCVDSFIAYIPALVLLITVIKISTVPFRYMMKGMKAIWFLLVIAVVFNLFLTPGEPIISFWKFTIALEGIRLAGLMAIRLVFLIIGTSVMTLTTTPNQLTDAIEKVLRPLRIFRIPIHEIAMMMSIALRFIPILLEETDKIMKAQIARGADFESGNLIKKVKAMVPLLVPLFISAFRRANDLAMAMESRCYRGGDGRTKMKPLCYKKRDFIAYSCFLIFFVGTLVIEHFVVF